MRRPLLAGNMKMNMTRTQSTKHIEELAKCVKDVSDRDVLMCPNFTALSDASKVAEGTNVKLGAQNMYFESSGAFTGDISAEMLLDCGVEYVILGHSERRHVFGETNEMINKKVLKALESGLKPILCVGELLEEREQGITEKVVEEHVKTGFDGVSAEQAVKIIIAYEPVWAIGTGKTATPDDAQAVHKFTRELLASMYSKEVADSIIIQYGGSVKPDNVDKLMAQPDIDGALVGGACLKVDSFERIVKFQ